MSHIDQLLFWFDASPRACCWSLIGVQVLLVLVHEMGHALAAVACGIPVERYQLGHGPWVRVARLGGCSLTLGLFPTGGRVVYAQAACDAASPLRRAFMAAGGPMASALVGLTGMVALSLQPQVLLWWVIMANGFLDAAFSISPFWSDGRKVVQHLGRAVVQRFRTARSSGGF